MSVLNRRVILNVYGRQTIATIGTLAQSEGKDEAAMQALAAASAFAENETFDLHVSTADVVVAVVEHLRAKGDDEAVRSAEAMIAALKRGEPQRLIIGSIDFGAATVGELDDQLEHIHRVGAPIIEGR